MPDEFVTSGEFGRWRADFQAFQERLDERLDTGFSGLNHRLDDLNGRTRKNSEAIVALDSRVENIRQSGCSQVRSHRSTLDKLDAGGTANWHKDKRVWFGGAGGASLIMALYEVAKAVQSFASKSTP